VDRVCFEGDRATGVVAVVDGTARVFDADHVVLSAGAIHSPAILLRSGIGPADQLRSLGVAVVASLAVGAGFQDHPHTYFGFPIHDSVRPPVNGRHTNACVRWTSGLSDVRHDMMGLVNGPAPALHGYAGIGLFVNRPFSRGAVRLSSTDPTVDPIVDMHLAEDQRDRVRLRQCVSMTQELLASEPFRAVIAGDVQGADGTRLSDLRDPAAVDAWIAQTVDGSAHASCTCRMGTPEEGGVVDGWGRVHGTTGLSVVDMSISPSVPRANTNLTAIMIGEQLAAEL
jgi:choline dehydrogenase